VAIVNPETSEVCYSYEIGEIWVSSEADFQPFNGLSLNRETSDAMIDMTRSRFQAAIIPSVAGGNGSSAGEGGLPQQQLNSKTYVRTGEVGLLWNYLTPYNGGRSTCPLLVLGSIGES